MSRDKPSLSYSPLDNTIKFTSHISTSPGEITETDISIAQIKSLHLSLDLAIAPLEDRLASLSQAVRDAVEKQQLSTARSLLKSKKLIENTLEKRRANLLQVEESLHAIDNAADNVAIIQSMKNSAAVMKTLNESVGGVEGVERITDALRDEMAVAEDIGKIIAEPGAAAVDESDVEDEFEALVAEEKKKVEEKERVEREKKEAIERVEREKKEALERAEQERREAIEKVEREKREAAEKAEREKKEKEEADATSRRLAELEVFEKKIADEKKQAEALPTLSVSALLGLPALPQSESSVEAVSLAPTEDEKALSKSMEMMESMNLGKSTTSPLADTEQKEEEEHKKREPVLA
jgi:charged multivesicular body protein 7